MKEEIHKNIQYFSILSVIFIIFFVFSAFIMFPVPGKPRAFYLMATSLIFGGWVGFILILISTVKIYKDPLKVNYLFKIYIIGILLIVFNLIFVWLMYFMIGYILITISLVGFIIALFFLKRIKVLCDNNNITKNELEQIRKSEKILEVKEEAIPFIKKFMKISILSIILFVVSAFFPNIIENRWNMLGISYLIYGGWEGFILILLSTILFYINSKHVKFAFGLYLIGTILIVINIMVFISYRVFTYFTIGIFLYLGAFTGFIISAIVLNKAMREILDIKKEKPFRPKPLTINKHMRYCENCQQYVMPYVYIRKRYIIMSILCLCVVGCIYLLLEYLIRKGKHCPFCKQNVSTIKPTPEEIAAYNSRKRDLSAHFDIS